MTGNGPQGEDETGLVFPCRLDVKVFMPADPGNPERLKELVWDELSREQLLFIRIRKSRAGRYQSFTCRIHARCRAELDRLFTRLSDHPDVVMVL